MHFRIQGLPATEFAPLFSMSDAELAGHNAVRRTADLIQRQEAVVAIERRVLEPFGHHGAAILLQRHRATQRPMPAEAAARRADEIAGEQPCEEIEHARVDVGLDAARLREGPVEIAPMARRTILCVKSAVRGFCRASRATRRASAFNSLAISLRVMRSLQSVTIAAKDSRWRVNSSYAREKPSSPAGSTSRPRTRLANS